MKVKRLTEMAKLPTRGSMGAAGLDLYADVPVGAIAIYPGETKKIHTGIAIELGLIMWGLYIHVPSLLPSRVYGLLTLWE